MRKYKEVPLSKLEEYFYIEKIDIKKIFLKTGLARQIKVKLPLILDEDIAKICGMFLDGYLDKNLKNSAFSQKKDISKIHEFSEIIENKFSTKCRMGMTTNETPTVFCNKALTHLFYHILNISKCDEVQKIPKWIWSSPVSVIKEYIRYAFAMEGSIRSPTAGKREIRFHSCTKSFVDELSKLLNEKFSINSKVFRYFIKNYGWKYYLSICGKENLISFYKIGFALESHQKRLKGTIDSYKPKAEEITLVEILNLPNIDNFHIPDVNKLFPYLHKRTIHWRLKNLLSKKYIKLESRHYSLTQEGINKALSLKGKIRICKVRTNSKKTQKKILEYLKNQDAHIAKIAKDLRINTSTVSDNLRRLQNKNQISLLKIDKFQRKIWKLKRVEQKLVSRNESLNLHSSGDQI